MAWTTPPADWSTIAVRDAADLNAYLVDDPLFLYDPPSCLLREQHNENYTSSTTLVANPFDTELWDTDGMHSGSLSTATVVTAGVYLHRSTLGCQANGTGRRITQIVMSDTSLEPQDLEPSVESVPYWSCLGATHHHDAAATIDLRFAQNSGGDLVTIGLTCSLLSHWMSER